MQFSALNVSCVNPDAAKADSPIDVTASGIVTEVKAVQRTKALVPIEVTAAGISTEVRDVHPEKVLAPTEVIAPDNVMD